MPTSDVVTRSKSTLDQWLGEEKKIEKRTNVPKPRPRCKHPEFLKWPLNVRAKKMLEWYDEHPEEWEKDYPKERKK